MTPKVVLEDRAGRAYNEPAFLHFLHVERARAGRGTRTSRLLVVRLAGGAAPRARGHARGLLGSLLASVRDTDVVGWVREGRLAGAILTHRADGGDAAIATGIERVKAKFLDRLPAATAGRVRMKVMRIQPLSKGSGKS